jgi:hypothetical protein
LAAEQFARVRVRERRRCSVECGERNDGGEFERGVMARACQFLQLFIIRYRVVVLAHDFEDTPALLIQLNDLFIGGAATSDNFIRERVLRQRFLVRQETRRQFASAQRVHERVDSAVSCTNACLNKYADGLSTDGLTSSACINAASAVSRRCIKCARAR